MFSTSANTFNRPSYSKERQPNNPEGHGIGYGYAIYQDYLILLGTTRETAERGESIICAYNLKEKRPEEVERESIPIAIGSSTACLFSRLKGVIFYGTIESSIGRMPMDSPSHKCTLASFRVEKGGRGGRGYFHGHSEHYPKNAGNDRLQLDLSKTPSGPGSNLSVSHVSGETIYVYDPSAENANFGSIHMLSERGGRGWDTLHVNTNNLKLDKPSRHSIFVNDSLYILVADVDSLGQTVETGYSLIEDIYMLDLKKSQNNGAMWERISPLGQAPGALTNISLAETKGMIYVFGLSEGKSVLWVFDIAEQEWKQVKDVSILTVRPDQKAAIYEGQLLIIDWGYSRDSVGIQYLSLDGLEFVGKTLCKDQAENFIQDNKKLYKNKPFADVVFEVEGEEIPAHKAILVSRSDYFMKMFTSGMSESHSTRIPIPDMRSRVFEAILQYIYCNEVELDEPLALDLIPVIDAYLMKGLKGVCEKYLCKQLRKDNVVDMLIVADRHEVDELKKACFRFIVKSLDNMSENEELMKLSKPLLVELVMFQKLCPQNDFTSQPKEEEQKSNFVSAPKQPDIQQSNPFNTAAMEEALARNMRGLQRK